LNASEREGAVEVGTSRIGLGVFARQAFSAGQTIGQVEGQRIDDADYESDYCIQLGDALSLEPDAPFRFLNHSCHPNCALVLEEQLDGREILWVESLRMILPGEELTIDYGWPAEAAVPCRCGSPDCRGWIVCREDLPRLGLAEPWLDEAG